MRRMIATILFTALLVNIKLPTAAFVVMLVGTHYTCMYLEEEIADAKRYLRTAADFVKEHSHKAGQHAHRLSLRISAPNLRIV